MPQRLREKGWDIRPHDEVFPNGNPADITWIAKAGENGWIILSADRRIRYNPAEKEALLKSGTLAFLLAGAKNLKGFEMADSFLAVERPLLREIGRHNPPGVFKVYYQEKRIALWLDATGAHEG